MRIAILGAGSLGTVIGAYISAGGLNVELIDINQAHVDELNRSGAKIIGSTCFTVPVKAITLLKMSGTYDLVLLLTKQLDNDIALRELPPFINDKSIICSLQNGVPEDCVAAAVGRSRVIAGSVKFGATWIKPGVSELTTAYNYFKYSAFEIGELDGTVTERIKAVKAVLDLVGGTVISDNLVGTKWTKLVINTSFSGLSAALNCTFGDILSNQASATCAVLIMDETIRTGMAKGVTLAAAEGFPIESLVLYNKGDIPERIKVLRRLLASSAMLKASMLQDLEKKQPTEIDCINGIVSKYAKDVGIATPCNDLVIKLVKQAEKNKTVPKFRTNIKYIYKLLLNMGISI